MEKKKQTNIEGIMDLDMTKNQSSVVNGYLGLLYESHKQGRCTSRDKVTPLPYYSSYHTILYT